MSAAVADAVADGRLPGRVWLYSNYHCNLACTYCLTDSSPSSPRRDLTGERMVAVAEQSADLGFTGMGVTGGEPFLRPDMVDVLLGMSEILPTVVLSNATLFRGDRLAPGLRSRRPPGVHPGVARPGRPRRQRRPAR